MSAQVFAKTCFVALVLSTSVPAHAMPLVALVSKIQKLCSAVLGEPSDAQLILKSLKSYQGQMALLEKWNEDEYFADASADLNTRNAMAKYRAERIDSLFFLAQVTFDFDVRLAALAQTKWLASINFGYDANHVSTIKHIASLANLDMAAIKLILDWTNQSSLFSSRDAALIRPILISNAFKKSTRLQSADYFVREIRQTPIGILKARIHDNQFRIGRHEPFTGRTRYTQDDMSFVLTNYGYLLTDSEISNIRKNMSEGT